MYTLYMDIYNSMEGGADAITASSLPTLFIAGGLRDPLGRTGHFQEILDKIVPMDHCTNWMSERVTRSGIFNRLLVLKAGTASSKSTGFVAEVYLRLVRNWRPKRGLMVTQPRVLTAIKNVGQILSVPDYKAKMKLGQDIGWSTQFDKLRPKRFGILSATIGTLTAIMTLMTDDDIMDSYAVIMIDETHERNLQTDTAILMLWNFLKRNGQNVRCPFVVFMSATFEQSEIIDYFHEIDNEVSLENNFIHVVGRSFGITIVWPTEELFLSSKAGSGDSEIAKGLEIAKGSEIAKDKKKSYIEMAVETVDNICRDNPDDPENSSDILIFMPGNAQIDETDRRLQEVSKKLFSDGLGALSILSISATAIKADNESYTNLDKSVKDYKVKIGDESVHPRRKIVISTAVAETGLTLDNLKYVIETGFSRETEFNPNFGSKTLKTTSAPKSRVTQRFGRAGRKTPGFAYPMYTQETWKSFREQQFPEIITDDFSQILLPVLIEQTKDAHGRAEITKHVDIMSIKMLTQPAYTSMRYALEKAYKLGMVAVDNDGIKITQMGLMSVKLSAYSMEQAKLIHSSFVWNYSTMDIIGIASILETDPRDLEKCNWDNVYQNAFGLDKARMKILISDDIIDLCVLAHAIIGIFHNDYNDLAEEIALFVKQFGIPEDIILQILTRRESLLSSMLSIGYDASYAKGNSIFSNAIKSKRSNVDEAELADNITRLKYCIHDAFFMNLLQLNEGVYKWRGLPVAVPSLSRSKIKEVLSVDEVIYPKYILFERMNIKEENGVLKATAPRVSTMSGYCYTNLH